MSSAKKSANWPKGICAEYIMQNEKKMLNRDPFRYMA